MTKDQATLLDDLKSRINPVYAHLIGTESHERRQCVEALEALAAEIAELRGLLSDCRSHLWTLWQEDSDAIAYELCGEIAEKLGAGGTVTT